VTEETASMPYSKGCLSVAGNCPVGTGVVHSLIAGDLSKVYWCGQFHCQLSDSYAPGLSIKVSSCLEQSSFGTHGYGSCF
jgi:hypothetical protein